MTKGLCAAYHWSTLVDCEIWLPSDRIGSAQALSLRVNDHQEASQVASYEI